MNTLNKKFGNLASAGTRIVGSSKAFIITCILIIIWAVFGPFSHYSDTWQLVANTVSTLATTLIVVLIQHSQNKDQAAMHAKLDELIRAIDKADNRLISIENKEDI